MDKEAKLEAALQAPYWIIDILPAQVPRDAGGQYFAVERYWAQEPQRTKIKQKHIDTVLKLNCYRDLALEDESNPPPKQVAETMQKRRTLLWIGDALLVSEPEETWMTLYRPDDALLELVKTLAAGEGLYVWQPPQQTDRTDSSL